MIPTSDTCWNLGMVLFVNVDVMDECGNGGWDLMLCLARIDGLCVILSADT
jgi:hypothetical protein